MAALTFTIEPDELQGLNALVELDRAADGGNTSTDAVTKARALMRKALADKLQAAGLPWAPSAAAVKQHAAEAAEPASGMRALMRNKKLRKDTAYAAAVALLVLLWGGYHQGWKWTGFQENDQLWDWLNLLLLPVVIGTIPLWIQYRKYIGRGRRVVYWTFIVAWTGFVIAGYLIPLTWTGFRGHKLWDWFVLLVIPAALAITMALTGIGLRLPQVLRSLHRYQKAIMVALAVGWIVTVIGGYLLRWSWTGYPGQSLWDWLQLLLVPLLLPTVLLPALLIWVSGNAEERATKAHEAAITRTPTTAAGTSP